MTMKRSSIRPRSSSVERLSIGGALRVSMDSKKKRSSSMERSLKVMDTNRPRSMIPKVSKPSSSTRQSSASSATSSSRYSVASSGSRLSSGRFSLYGNSRRLSRNSGMSLQSISGVVKDPRPLSNKAYQQKCMKAITLFLVERQFPHEISPKFLNQPSNSAFMKVMQFILEFVIPNTTFKLEDIPKILKELGYPFNINKSSMASIGSPHTWPAMLAAINWLVELIQFGLNRRGDSDYFASNAEEFDSIAENKLMFDYTCKTYDAFLQGQDTFEDYDEQLEKEFSEKSCVGGGLEGLEAENRRLRAELEFLEKETDKVQSLPNIKETLLVDTQRYDSFLEKIRFHHAELEKQANGVIQEISEEESQLTSKEIEKQRLLKISEQQKLSQSDIERIKIFHQELQRQTVEAENREHEVDQEIWQKEIEISKQRELLENLCNKYNKLAQTLKLIPTTAENANGVDFELKATYLGYAMDSHFQNTIKPELFELKQKFIDSCNKKTAEKMGEQDLFEQLSEYLTEIQEEITTAEREMKVLNDDIECKKQMFQTELKDIQNDIENQQKEMMELQVSSKISVQKAMSNVKEAKSLAELSNKEIAQQRARCCSAMKRLIDIIMQHMQTIQTRSKELVENSQQVLEKSKSEARHVEELLNSLSKKC